MLQITDDDRREFSQIFKDARLSRNLHQYQAAQASGVNQNTIGLLERTGPFLGLRAIDLLKLVAYYGLDVYRVSALLGVGLGQPFTIDTSPLARQAQILAALSTEDQQFVIGVVDVLLRGIGRG